MVFIENRTVEVNHTLLVVKVVRSICFIMVAVLLVRLHNPASEK